VSGSVSGAFEGVCLHLRYCRHMAAQPKPLPPWGSAVAGATGAVLANAVVYPLDMFAYLSSIIHRG